MFLTVFSPVTSIPAYCVLWQITWNNTYIIFLPRTSLKVSSKTVHKLPYLVILNTWCFKHLGQNILHKHYLSFSHVLDHVLCQNTSWCLLHVPGEYTGEYISPDFPMFSAKTYWQIVYLSFWCYFLCLDQNNWPLPAVYTFKYTTTITTMPYSSLFSYSAGLIKTPLPSQISGMSAFALS